MITCLLAVSVLGGKSQAQDLLSNVYGRDYQLLNGKWGAIVDLYDQGERMQVYKNRKPQDNKQFYEYSFDGGLVLNVPADFNSQMPELKFYEGTVWYGRSFDTPKTDGKRLFLYFGAVSYRSKIYLNGEKIASHEGGFTPFQVEITDKVKQKDNFLVVKVNNTRTTDAIPAMSFDWWNYGGITRDVMLVSVPQSYIKDHFIQLDKVQSNLIRAKVTLSEAKPGINVQVAIPELGIRQNMTTDANGIAQATIKTKKLQRWSPDAPKLYDVTITSESDRLNEQIGFRNLYVKGEDIYLNDQPIFLRSISFHEEIPQRRGRAFSEADATMLLSEAKELGANMIRLAHYPQATYMYDLMDKHGIVTWAEIPFVGPGGYADKGFVDQPSFRENGKEQLKEMIRQHYNHPSICFWGLFNELKEQGDNPVEYIKELNAIAHQEDPTRPTTSASNQEGALNFITDHIAWNRYDGWYGATPATLATWLDATHKNHPEMKIAISEYGAGASIYHQQDSLVQTVPGSWWHPENWQTEYHIQNWKIINERPYVWASFVWNMFDFGAAHRTEGDRPGINDKGLVTYDRKIKKDAYYFYRANWNPEPMIYIAGRRNVNRVKPLVDVQVFSNVEEVILIVNDCQCGKMKPDSLKVCLFKDVPLRKGRNEIEVRASDSKKQLIDRCTWILQ